MATLLPVANDARRREDEPGGPAIERRAIDGITRVSDGDWAERCTAAVELGGGRIQIVDGDELRGWSMLDRRAARRRALADRLVRGEPVANAC